MARHNAPDAAFAGGMIGMLLAGILAFIAVLGVLLICALTELWHIYSTQAHKNTRGSKVLWAALIGLGVVFCIAGIVATQPGSAPLGVFLACWGFCIYTIVCIATDHIMRRNEKPPEELALSDVASWQPKS